MLELENIVIYGGGRLGQAWAVTLAGLGHPPIAVVSRREQPDAVAGPWVHSMAEIGRPPAVLLLCVGDDHIAPVAASLAEQALSWAGVVVLHGSGLRGRDPLAPLAQVGCCVGSLHPLQSFSLPAQPGKMKGIFFALEGEDRAVEVGAELARRAGGWSRRLTPEQKVPYHASAVMASNLTVSLLEQACHVAAQAGLGRAEALEMLLPLLAGTLDNLQRLGLPDALTGPVSRGDVQVVRRHLEVLTGDDKAVYEALSRTAVGLAREQGRADEAGLSALGPLLTDGTPARRP